MILLIIQRVLSGILVVFCVATFAFLLLKAAPGGPFDEERNLPEETRRNLEARYRLDLPVYQQYFHYMKGLVVGDFGYSFKRPQPVREIIAESFPISLQLGLGSLIVALVLGVGLGVFAAAKQNTWWDHSAMTFALCGISIPSFVLAPLLISLFSLTLGWFPPARWDGLSTMVLPSLTLGMIFMGVIARLARSGLLETLQQDYIRTARAKGLSGRSVVIKHALRIGLMPVVTYLGPATAALITGSFIVEKIFQIPGLGFYFVASISDRDAPVLAGVLVFYSLFLIGLNLLVDIAYGILDPRVRGNNS